MVSKGIVDFRKTSIQHWHRHMSTSTWPGLQTIVQREELLLAPYAMHSKNSTGRQHPEPNHLYRGPFQRDRDRILHSASYRRLADKTQVFTGQGDYHRTRLTHTLEVASIARTIGRALRLNEDLIEAMAMVHDIGHPPFGHAGEEALHECLLEDGGFSHNQYALCLVQELEIRYEHFPGLNLTREVLEGQSSRVDKTTASTTLLEAQVVDAADSITYDSHDVDDAVQLNLLTMDELMESPMVREAARRVKERSALPHGQQLRKAIVHELIDWQVSNMLEWCSHNLKQDCPSNSEVARKLPFQIGPDNELTKLKTELEQFLHQRVYRHERLIKVRRLAQDQLREMFDQFQKHPELLPVKFQHRIQQCGLRRSIGDYLAGMTDRYFQQQHQRLT